MLDIGFGQAMGFGPTLLPADDRVGEFGTAVIAGRRDTHFRFLEGLEAGDTIVVEDMAGKATATE